MVDEAPDTEDLTTQDIKDLLTAILAKLGEIEVNTGA